jgi:FixJ family two-component response regulator
MRRRRPRSDAARRKQEALKLLAADLPTPAVAQALQVDVRTVQRYKREAALWMAMRGVSA